MNGEPRVVTDAESTQWSCSEATAGVAVVCTPSGGARSVRLDLPPDWRELPEADLLDAISRARS